MFNSGLSPAAFQGGGEPPADKATAVYTRGLVPTNWLSGWTLQQSIEPFVSCSSLLLDSL